MADTITFTAGGQYITVQKPWYGYEVSVHMPIITAEKYPFGYEFRDLFSDGSKDYRVLHTAKFMLPAAQKSDLNDFFRSAQLGRCETVTLSLGATPSGFFPFGPDQGDVGDFTLHLIDRVQGGQLWEPWKYWQDDLSFVMVSAPGYSPAAGASQGTVSIGTVSGLLYPQDGFRPVSHYNHRTDLSVSGVPHSVDGVESGDGWETAWDQVCNTGNAAALIAYLTGASGRAQAIDLTVGSDGYPYGMDKGDSGVYNSQFLGSERTGSEIVLRVRHDGYNRFTIPLSFWLNSRLSIGGGWQDTDGAGVILQDTDGAATIYQDVDAP